MGIGDWGLGPIPNPQSPIPNPQSPFIFYFFIYNINFKIKINNLYYLKINTIYEYLSLTLEFLNFLLWYLGVDNLAEVTLCLVLNCIASPISLGVLNILTYL